MSDIGYWIKVYSDIRYNVGLRSLQSDIGSSDNKLSPISLITDIGVSAQHGFRIPKMQVWAERYISFQAQSYLLSPHEMFKNSGSGCLLSQKTSQLHFLSLGVLCAFNRATATPSVFLKFPCQCTGFLLCTMFTHLAPQSQRKKRFPCLKLVHICIVSVYHV
jgi:hypothetical protein